MKPSLAESFRSGTRSAVVNYFQSVSDHSSFLDVYSAVNPSYWVDYDAAVDSAGMFLQTLHLYRTFMTNQKSGWGPLSGEGNSHMLYLGYIDDVEAQISGKMQGESAAWWGERAPILVDFDLLKLKPKAIVHGVGYYSRFNATSYGDQLWGQRNKDDILTYMATEIAFAHGSFIETPSRIYDYIENATLEQTYVYPLAKAVLNSTPSSITYYRNGAQVGTASQYISHSTYGSGWDDYTNANFMCQVRIIYSNGVRVYVNRNNNAEWNVTSEVSGLSGAFSYNVWDGSAKIQGTTVRPDYNLARGNGWLIYYPTGALPKSSDVEEAGVKIIDDIPKTYSLQNNFPNPFNPSTVIRFTLPVTSNVTLSIYNMMGQEVKTFEAIGVDGTQQFTWDGTNMNNEHVSSGIYIYRIQAVGNDGRSFTKSAKMTLLK